jgi:sec-independent protein translocase protein TatB
VGTWTPPISAIVGPSVAGGDSQHDPAYHDACYCALVFGLGFSELCVLVLVAVVVLGPKDLPRYLRQFGKMAGRLRNYAFELREKSGIDELLRNEGLDRDIADIRKLARIARGEVDGVVGAVTRGANPKRWRLAADAETAPYPDSEAKPLPAGLLLDGDHEFPALGADSYGALPDDATMDGELPASPLANDPVYAKGESIAPAPTLPA